MSGEEGNQMTCALDFSIDMNKIKTFDQIKNLSSVKKVLAKYNYSDETKKNTIRVLGRSTASGGDVFDEEFAKKLSLTRAQEKAFEITSAFYEDLEQAVIFSLLEQVKTYKLATYESIIKCEQHAFDLVDDFESTNPNNK
jgi:hypothetical protein